MDNKINLSQLSELLAQEAGISKAAAEQFAKNFFDIISQNVLTEGIVKVKGFGTFKLIDMEDRESVNVNTGERFTIEGHQKITFIPDTDLKERVNKPFAAFETVPITEQQAAQLGDIENEPDTDEVKLKTTDNMENSKKESESRKELNEKKADSKVVKEEEKSGRTGLKIIIWILSAIVVLALIIFLLWPLIGGKLLGRADEKVNVKAPATTTAPAAKPAPAPAATTAKPAAEAKFALTKADEAKALPLFTVADTVNYKITGTLATHTMVKGDMLTTIALKYYGTKKLWPYIAKYNNIKSRSFKRLPVGQKIKVPKLANK